MKFFVRSAVFLFIGLLILQGLAYVAKSEAPDGTSTFLRIDQEHVRQVLENRASVEAIVLGSSHGDDIEFSNTRYHGYSLARAWGDFFETQYYLKYLVPKLDRLKIVFIPVGYFSFDWDNAQVDKLVIRRNQVYTIIPSWTVIPGDFKNFFIGRGSQLFPFQTILRQDNWQGVFYGLITGKAENNVIQLRDENCTYMDEKQLSEFSIQRAKEQIQFAKQVRLARPTIRKDTYEVIVEIIEFLQSDNIRIVFFTPPYYSAYNKYYQENDYESIAAMRDLMVKLQQEFGITYYDFSADDRFVSDYKLYKDSDHLNLCGKRLFSQILDKALDENSDAP
jgi:hypothetical protein